VKELLPDALWREVELLLPPHPSQPKGGTPWKSDRDCLRGILFVLRSGIPWDLLPTEVFGVSGVTCWRRLRDWTHAGVWPKLHALVIERLEAEGGIDHSIMVIDSATTRALFGGRTRARIRPIAANAAANVT